MLDAVAVFPAEVGADVGAEGFVLEVVDGFSAGGLEVLGPDEGPGFAWCCGEAVEFPFRGSC